MTYPSTCRKPCTWLYLIGVIASTLVVLLWPGWRSETAMVQRHEVEIRQMRQMQQDIRQTQESLAQQGRALERLTVSVEYLARGIGQPIPTKESRP